MNALNFYAEKPPFVNISLHKDVTKRQGQKYDDLKFEIHPVNDSKPILVQDKLTFNHY